MKKIVIKKPLLVCYDWDNTLINTNLLCMYAFNKLFTEFGMKNIDQMELDRINGYVFDEYLKERFGDGYIDAKAKYRSIYEQNAVNMLKPLDDALGIVEFFHKLGIKQVVMSNKYGSMVREEAKRMGFDKYIERFYGLDDVGFAKPDKSFFDFVKKEEKVDSMNFDQENLLFFGDSSVDIDFARNINAKLFFVGPEYILEKYFYTNSELVSSYSLLLDNLIIDN